MRKKLQEIAGNPDIHFSLTDKLVDGKLKVTQGIIAGCAGGNYTNVMEAAHILKNRSCGCDEFSLSVYPSSQPVYIDLVRKGAIADSDGGRRYLSRLHSVDLASVQATPLLTMDLSIRHTTRNFPNREGSKPGVTVRCPQLL